MSDVPGFIKDARKPQELKGGMVARCPVKGVVTVCTPVADGEGKVMYLSDDGLKACRDAGYQIRAAEESFPAWLDRHGYTEYQTA